MGIKMLEVRKIMKNKINLIVPLGILLMFLLPLLLNGEDSNYKIDSMRYQISSNEGAIQNLKDEPGAEIAVEDMEEIISYLGPLVNHLEAGRIDESLEYEFKYENKILKDMQAGKLFAGPIVDQEKKVAELEYIYINNLDKIEESSIQNLLLANYLKFIFSEYLPSLFLLALLVLLIATIVSSDKRKHTINLVNIYPKSRFEIFIDKYSIYLGFTTLSWSVPLLILSIFIGLKNGIGDFNYPIAYITQNSNVDLLSTSSFLIKVFSMILLWSVFLLSLNFLISLFTGNLFIYLVISIGILFVSQFNMAIHEANKGLTAFTPTSYVDYSNVILGGRGLSPLPTSSINFQSGSMVLLIFSIIISAIILVRLKTKKRF